ncbi:Uncharacterised protein [BD1-7 clade bacterium]|uniref:UDP-N-acetylglucosamine--N-acetylmuramyl-(Pentapeptide) pyrophosphoryl-undecaprenol N-acetylglucosamine transferase n=1 Tax=BD1-7 clade bacterium TaxID=2029982 RepID=A0A5S9QWK2_9GAMM|nr:Uncharacterised protein [BD1-7 clade bacterium]
MLGMERVVVFCFGEGGHAAQANRLAKLLLPELLGFRVVTVSDDVRQPAWSDKHYEVVELRSKHSHWETLTNNSLVRISRVLRSVGQSESVKVVVSTGPGIGVVAGIYFKLKGCKVIHIETWSRFKTRSFTGRIMYLLSDRFYVQNESLLTFYPHAVYAGTL